MSELDKIFNQHDWKDKTFWYEIDKTKQSEHKCLHENCPSCNGTGMNKRTGEVCIHYISCPCPKCTPRCSAEMDIICRNTVE